MRILGRIRCEECGWEEDAPDIFFECKSCNSFKTRHIPDPIIRRCHKNNVQGFGEEGLKRISKKVDSNKNRIGNTYKRIKEFVDRLKPGQKITTYSVERYLGITQYTEGDIVRPILSMLVCQGYLNKTFMKGRKRHEYRKNLTVDRCRHLDKVNKGKYKRCLKCSHSFKGEESEYSSKYFPKKRG